MDHTYKASNSVCAPWKWCLFESLSDCTRYLHLCSLPLSLPFPQATLDSDWSQNPNVVQKSLNHHIDYWSVLPLLPHPMTTNNKRAIKPKENGKQDSPVSHVAWAYSFKISLAAHPVLVWKNRRRREWRNSSPRTEQLWRQTSQSPTATDTVTHMCHV